ncbi:MAG: PAS domain-containing protein [Acidimicrobiia bacterium]|nr:PAS domain-containing protein [Acidimicrobiia bacterium]
MDEQGGRTTSSHSDETFHLLVDQVRDYAIFMLDPDGRVRTWNQGAARFKGYREDEIVGQYFGVFYPEEDRAAGKPERALAEAREEGRFEDEGWRVRKDGTPFWASVVITRLVNPDGSLRGYAKVTRDLTERRMAAEDRLRLEHYRDSERHALELNDDVVQGLAVAKIALELGQLDEAGGAIEATLAASKRIVSELLGHNHTRPGDLRRDEPELQ